MSATVSIGGRPYTIARFKTYKAVLVGEVLSNVTKDLRELFKEAAEFRREYRQTNMLQITRQMCLERVAELESGVEQVKAGTTEEVEDGELTPDQQVRVLEARAQSWRRQLEDMGDRPFVEVPQEPDETEVLMAVFPRAFRMRHELAEVLALLITPDSELRESWRKDTIHKTLREKGEQLLEDSDPEEIVQLAVAAKQVVGDQFRPLTPALRGLLGQETPETTETQQQAEGSSATTSSTATQPTPSPPPDSPGQPAPPPQPDPTPTPPQPTPTSSSPTSSTPSQAPTNGQSRTSDSLSPGDSPLVSSGA